MHLYGLHPNGCTCGCQDIKLSDLDPQFKKIDDAIIQDYVKKVHTGAIGANDIHEPLWREYFNRLERSAEAGFGKKFSTIDPSLKDVQLGQQFRHNLAQFAAAKQKALNDELRALLKTKDGQIRSLNDFEKACQRSLNNFNNTYLGVELEAAFAQADTAKRWEGFLKRAYLYPNLKYVTAHDEHVRESHRPLHGIIRPIDDPFWKTHTPPLGYRCRCIVIQTDSEVTELPTESVPTVAGFGHNPYATGEVFNKEHPYFKNAKKQTVEMDKVVAKLEYNNLYPSSEFKKVQFDHNTGGYLVTHIHHGEGEFQNNIQIARELIQNAQRLILLPIIENRKNPDMLVNEILGDIKKLESDDAIISIQRNIKKANNQEASHIVLQLTEQMTFDDTIKAVGYALQNGRNKGVTILTLILPNGRLVELGRQQVIDRSFKESIKKEWQKP